MKSLVAKRSIAVGNHKTSVTLEAAFWNGLKAIASDRNLTLSELVTAIDSERPNANLSSAIRLFVLDHYRTMTGAAADARNAQVEMPAKNPALHTTGEPL
jgi:predicted DNA-binding ribbon-helix-helix protein